MTASGEHPLRGVRLGKMERWLLLHAPSPDALSGYVLDVPDAGVREQLRVAAIKLERVGLVERRRLVRYVRAADPRRSALVLRDERLWVREDQTRAHAVRRNVVWQSPFGFEVVLRYRDLLATGAPIRWDSRTVLLAQRAAKRSSGEHQHAELRAREDDARDAVALTNPKRAELAPWVPSGVSGDADRERWDVAVRLAARRSPRARPDVICGQALELYATVSLADLKALEARTPRPPTGAAERFRRTRHSVLGQGALAGKTTPPPRG